MVRKVRRIIVATLLTICCVATSAKGATFDVYESGNLSSTYVTYFKDIISGQSILDDYVAFRSGQYTYTMVVGDLEYDGDFQSDEKVKVYEFNTETGYNQATLYSVINQSNFYLNVNGGVLYSNLGDYPQLIDRGGNIETITAILLCIFMLSAVIDRIFKYCLRGRNSI